MIRFKMVAESHCDRCGEWRVTDWVDVHALSVRAFKEQVLVQLEERGWRIDGTITCPICLNEIMEEVRR